MLICKNLDGNDVINSIDEWFQKCPPQNGTKHWKNGRSAKETAKHWLYVIPEAFKDILKGFNFTYEMCSPEYVTRFDNYGGNGRNHDLLIIAQDKKDERAVIAIESKVDESFDKNVGDYLEQIKLMKQNGKPSRADKRIYDLIDSLFGPEKKQAALQLSYQLLTAVAGTIAEAKKQNATKAVFLVQTFLSPEMSSEKHRKNQRDLDLFLELISNCKYRILHDGDVVGPIHFPGNTTYLTSNIELWIGKYSVKL